MISMELSIFFYFKGFLIKSSIKLCNSVPEDCFILANSADPDEIHLGIHCLPKYFITSIQIDKHCIGIIYTAV